MPPTYCPCPRPILKRRTPSPDPEKAALLSPRDESSQLLNIDPSVLQPLVHFPPAPGLTHTFLAYPPSIYDRSPIVVTPNHCSLPERGCPGKTYVPGEDDCDRLGAAVSFASRHNRSGSGKKSRDHSPAGRHLHPRAVRVHLPREDDDDELTPKATPVAYNHPLPPLIPDLSSSSESEESDGFVSPPTDHPSMTYAPLYATSLPASSPTPARTPGLSIPIPQGDLSGAFAGMYLSPMSSPTSPMTFRSRIASYSSRSSSPARSLSPGRTTARSHSPCRDAAAASPTTRRRRSHSKTKRVRGCAAAAALGVYPASPSELEAHYKTLSEQSYLSSAYDYVPPDDGCLGGF